MNTVVGSRKISKAGLQFFLSIEMSEFGMKNTLLEMYAAVKNSFNDKHFTNENDNLKILKYN